MGYYDIEKNVNQYIDMAEGYDGRLLIQQLGRYLPEGSSVLELGMGPGKDLALLSEIYKAAGSDSSELFVNRYIRDNPGSDVLVLDALTLDTHRTFNAVYSNKVLSHLTYEEMRVSFQRQAEILEPGGLVMHSFWFGSEAEKFDGLMFYQIEEEKLKSLIENTFETLEMERYTEMEENDSLYGIFRLL